MASLELAETIAQLLKDVPDKDRAALLAACREENQEEEQPEIAPSQMNKQEIRVTEDTGPATTIQPPSEKPVDDETEEDEPIASLVKKRKISVQNEEGPQKEKELHRC